ncbi:MAG: DUF3137 domain-containing protein [Pseudomonadota bacterium]
MDSDFQLEDDIAQALMDLPPEFQRFGREYQNEIRPMLRAREGERIKASQNAKYGYIGGGALAVIGGAVSLFLLQFPQLAAGAVIAGIAIGAIGSSGMRKLSGEAKDLLVKPIAQSFELDFTPKPGSVGSIGEHRRLGMVPSYDRSKFEDHLYGSHKGVAFEFFEANLKQRRTTTSNGRTRTKYVTVFDGQCLRFDFHKRFFGETLVRRDAGWFNAFGGRSGMDRARLEDPEFEKAFEVYTTDQVEARFLLTPDMMQSLVDLERTFRGDKLRCAFSGEEMFIAVEGGNLFEPGTMFKPLDNPERVRELLMDFAAVFNLIEKVSARRKAEEADRGAPEASA